MKLNYTISIILLGSISCVQIPKESVQLSKAMGEDLKKIRSSHIALVNLHYEDIERNINDLVDRVYAPYQIGKLVRADMEDMRNGKDDTMSGYLAAAPNDAVAAQKALENMEFFVNFVRNDIENYRMELLLPIQKQRREVLDRLQSSYASVISANASITGHLASLRKVKDAQGELMEKLGFESQLNEKLGKEIADLAGEVNQLIDQANTIDTKSDGAIDQFNEIKDKILNLTK